MSTETTTNGTAEKSQADYVAVLSLKEIDTTAENIRGPLDTKQVERLAGTIRTVGLIHPPSVEKVGGKYILRAGFKRVAALKLLKRADAPFHVWPAGTWKEAGQIAENSARDDVNQFFIAEKLHIMVDGHTTHDGQTIAATHTAESAAEEIGLSVSHVRNLLRVYKKLAPEILAAWKKKGNEFPLRMLTAWAALDTPEEQIKFFEEFTGGDRADRKRADKGKKRGARGSAKKFRSKAEIREMHEGLREGGKKEALAWVMGLQKTLE